MIFSFVDPFKGVYLAIIRSCIMHPHTEVSNLKTHVLRFLSIQFVITNAYMINRCVKRSVSKTNHTYSHMDSMEFKMTSI